MTRENESRALGLVSPGLGMMLGASLFLGAPAIDSWIAGKDRRARLSDETMHPDADSPGRDRRGASVLQASAATLSSAAQYAAIRM
jgi:hypothetical protein